MNPLYVLGGKFLGSLFLIIALVAGYNAFVNHQRGIGDARTTALYEKAIDAQKAEASRVLAEEIAKVATIEGRLNDLKNQRELKDAESVKTNLTQATRLRDLAGPAGRLRDPNAPTGCGGCREDTTGEVAAATGIGSGDATEARGLLSRELTAFLLSQAASADEINAAYASCRADAYSVRDR